MHPRLEKYRNKYKDNPSWQIIEGCVMQAIYSFIMRNYKIPPKNKITYSDVYFATRDIFSSLKLREYQKRNNGKELFTEQKESKC